MGGSLKGQISGFICATLSATNHQCFMDDHFPKSTISSFVFSLTDICSLHYIMKTNLLRGAMEHYNHTRECESKGNGYFRWNSFILQAPHGSFFWSTANAFIHSGQHTSKRGAEYSRWFICQHLVPSTWLDLKNNKSFMKVQSIEFLIDDCWIKYYSCFTFYLKDTLPGDWLMVPSSG